MVVETLDQAKRLAFGSHRGTKVVTIDGKMIDEFGLVTVKQRPVKGLVSTVDAKKVNDI